MDKLTFFKQYIDKANQNHRYGIGAVDKEGNKYIEIFDGTKSDKVAYGRVDKIIPNQLYSISPATCGHAKVLGGDGSCEVGTRKMSCTSYSVNKCAVYYIEEEDLDKQKYNILYEDIQELINNEMDKRMEAVFNSMS